LKNITIAIDGFSSTGKSTLAKQLATKLNYIYVDSGAMYRAVTFYAMQNQLISKNEFKIDKLIAKLTEIDLKFKFNPELGFAEIYLNNVNIEREIRTLAVSELVSSVAEISEVRKMLVDQQQEMGKNKGVVMDGRDIGTVVFPNAELKLFMTASAETRAKRRFDELIEKGDDVQFDEILKNVQHRDYIDTTRDDSPLIKAEDAIEIDNSNLTKVAQFELVYAIVLKKLN
jgi:cytidylate kinase